MLRRSTSIDRGPLKGARSTGTPSNERYDAQLRAAQLQETLAVVDSAMIIPLAAALGLAALFLSSPEQGFVLGLVGAMAVVAVGASIAAKVMAARSFSKRGVTIARGIAIAIAAGVGVIWGVVPVALFTFSDTDRRFLVLAALGAAIANCYRLGSLERICLFYVAPICAGSFIGLAASGSAGAAILSVLLPLYGWLVATHCARINALSARRIVDRIRVAEQDETIHALLLDFDENSSDWIWRTDEHHRLADASESFCRAIGRSAAEIDRATLGDILTGFGASAPTSETRAILGAMSTRKPFRNQIVEIRTGGASRWWRLSGKPLQDTGGAFLGYHGVGSDMTGERNSEHRISYLANYDALTGLANRANFQAYAARRCEAAARDGHCGALLCMDLDGFKSINDNLGHDGGDAVLKQVAARLVATAPAYAFVARLGGDEFALWIDTTPAKAEAVARDLVEALCAPFEIHGLQATIGASIGISFAPKHSIDPDNLLVKADIALYRAKAEGKRQSCVFVEAFETALLDRRKLEADLKLALVRGEFELHYQPKIDAANGNVLGFEALIRWQSPDRGFVSPTEFIPAAESTGLIGEIGRWVLFEACRTAAKWPRDVHVAVNVSPPQMRAPDFMQDVAMALKTSGLHPSRLEIEVTESVFLEKSATALENLRTLNTRGVKIALDDFGTGYSSLNYLVGFPVDRIKIDRTFVADLVSSPANQAIVDAILGLAKTLSIKVTAEGVETKEQALLLKRRKCDDLQGYLFSKPRPGSDVDAMTATVPILFRQAIPTHLDSPLALVLEANRRQMAS